MSAPSAEKTITKCSMLLMGSEKSALTAADSTDFISRTTALSVGSSFRAAPYAADASRGRFSACSAWPLRRCAFGHVGAAPIALMASSSAAV